MMPKPEMRKCPITGKMLPFDRSEKRAEVKRARAAAAKQAKRDAEKAEKAKAAKLAKRSKKAKAQADKDNAEAQAVLGIDMPEDGAHSSDDRSLAVVAEELADLRKKWVDIGPSKRSGKTGDKVMKDYRRLALEFWHMSGNHPPPIYADL